MRKRSIVLAGGIALTAGCMAGLTGNLLYLVTGSYVAYQAAKAVNQPKKPSGVPKDQEEDNLFI